MFTWLPLYKEVTTWILQYRNRQAELCNILREIGFTKNLTDIDKNGEKPLKVMDPLTFMGFFQKPKSEENRKQFWEKFIKIARLKSDVPSDFSGLPSAQPMNLWFFKYEMNRQKNDMNLLWDLSEQAIKGQIQQDTFDKVISMHGIALAKLTQGLFWLNPEKYYPIDSHKNYLDKVNIDFSEVDTFAEYQETLSSISKAYPMKLYELSYTAWNSNQTTMVKPEKDTKFSTRLKQYDADKLDFFLSLLRKVVLELDIKPDDKRVVFGDRPRRLNFIVGQRYSFNLYFEEDITSFGFISKSKLFKDSVEFSGPVKSFYTYTENISDITRNEEDFKVGLRNELNRTKLSGFLSSDEPEFRELIFGKIFRKIDEPLIKSQKYALNTILYGPPGTGKTFLSKRMALAILEDKTIDEILNFYPTGKMVSDKFNEYQRIGQAGFSTFHQSFGYEDFIEGIKPKFAERINSELPDAVEDTTGQSLVYHIEDGIFKQIALRAKSYRTFEGTETTNKSFDRKFVDDLNNKEFFKMSLGNTQLEQDIEIYNYCIENNCIALGWGHKNDFTKADTNEKILAVFDDGGGARSKYEITAMKCFRLWMEKGDVVFISDGNLKVRAIAQIESDYYFDIKTPISPNHFRKVKWLLKDADIPVTVLYNKQFSQQTIYQLWTDEVKKEFFQNSAESENKNDIHVLIIDEINRGNVSAIFGELITLIEEDKRQGRKETITVTLPYSKTEFSVPDNLYIIGTMNTADRSVEALDSALRRRFAFEEMPPRYDLPELEKKVDGIQLKDILLTINKRLEKLLDKDHKIGHSYFMFQQSTDITKGLIEAFYKNIIPLLQEYFFGDYGKIGLVLGKGFVLLEDTRENLFSEFNYDGVEMLQAKPIHTIIDYRDPISTTKSGITFSDALTVLMRSAQ